MKLKKGMVLIALTLVAISIVGAFSNVQAGDIVTKETLAINKMGYSVNEKEVFRISISGKDNNETFYCIKAGPGFGSSTMSTNSTAEYTNGTGVDSTGTSIVGNLRNRSQISTKYASALPQDDKNYVALMWILDQCYVPARNNVAAEQARAESNREILLNAVEDYIKNNYVDLYADECDAGDKDYFPDEATFQNHTVTYHLTDKDIIFVQQLAIWHYTNPSADDAYHFDSMPYPAVDTSADGPIQNNHIGSSRVHAMNALFDYLVLTPAQTGFSYDYTKSASQPVQLYKTNVTVETTNKGLVVGPYKIQSLNDIEYTLTGTLTDESGNSIDYTLLDSNKNEVTSGTTLKDLVETNFYLLIPSNTNTSKLKFTIEQEYMTTQLTYWGETNITNVENATAQPVVEIEKEVQSVEDYIEYTKPDEPEPDPEKLFDLALRKFITSVNDVKLAGANSREPQISDETLSNLAEGITLTTEKVHTKDPLIIKNGDKIVYTIRIYNEGEINGYATEITDYLPEGLKLVPADESTINTQYGWTTEDGTTIKTNYAQDKLLKAFDKEKLASGEIDTENEVKSYKGLSYIDLQIECQVTAKVGNNDQVIKNIAEITAHKDTDGNTGKDMDRDSQPGNVTTNPDNYNPTNPTKGIGEQDDDDYEPLLLVGEYFDLSLRKFITEVKDPNKETANVLASREPVVDVTPLVNGSGTTAIYNHTKEPVGVSNGDIVTYTIRVYNEGKLDGYVTEITDHLPSQLEFIVDDDLNAKYGWTVSADGRTVSTDITSPKTTHSASRDLIYADRKTESDTDKVLLEAFDRTADSGLDYIDVQIRCKVKENIDLYEKITNIAEITEFTDSEGNTITDRDSQEENTVLPTDATLPEYRDTEIKSGDTYIPGQQDDDDFEKLVLQKFDLALRKFITGVMNGETTTNITNRAPVFTKESDTKYTYEHTKEPVEVANGNIVIYTLRIFNEGNMAGYAAEVRDDLPEGLEFLPDNSINTAFGWKMYKEDGTETTNVSEASYIKTDFLSKDKEANLGDNLIDAFNPETMTMPDYKDIKVAFKVTEPNTSDRIIINQAQISEDSDENGDPVDDIDSIPDKWNEGEDDQDIEKIKVNYFDLSLKKWVTESIVTVDGKTTTTKSGHTGDENPESPMKVEIPNGKVNDITVKFKFKIKVTNEGEIAGYATELIDYIPDGLKFVAKDNPKWTVNKDGKVITDQLKGTLLQPGESATVEIVLTWINGSGNMGEKVNWAEISKDQNEYNSPDIDSTPGNEVKGEDDIDQAPVLLSPATGSIQTYMILTLSCVVIVAAGIFLIKKFVI